MTLAKPITVHTKTFSMETTPPQQPPLKGPSPPASPLLTHTITIYLSPLTIIFFFVLFFVLIKGRGSAIMVAGVWLCMVVLLHLEMAHAATYTVGDTGGWTLNVVAWPKGKRFRAGDTLVFNYNPSMHNVVTVNRAGYSSCNAPSGAKVYTSGQDQIKLVKGQNFFICSFAGHCQSGMKIAVTAM